MKFSEVGYDQYFTVDGFVYRKVQPLGNVNAVGVNRKVWLQCTFDNNRIVKLCDEYGKEIGVTFSEIKIGQYFKAKDDYIWLRCIGGVLAFGTIGEPYNAPVICESNAFTDTYFVISKPDWVKLPG